MGEWLYDEKPIDENILANYFGFVYSITNNIDGRCYYGKKRLKFTRTKKINKKKIKTTKDSDWREYYGSSKELLADVEKYGPEKFTRKIIRLCCSKGECSYWELYYQMTNHVLLHPESYYNNYVGARIHRKHVLTREKT